MKEYIDSTPSELLTLLLDGELDTDAQSKLFAELARNGELQEELREMLAIRQSVQKDFEAFSPPPEATTAVFDRVGFGAHQAAAGGSGAAVFGFLRRNWWVSAIGLLLISFVGYNLTTGDDAPNLASENIAPTRSIAMASDNSAPTVSSIAEEPAITQSAPAVASISADNNPGAAKTSAGNPESVSPAGNHASAEVIPADFESADNDIVKPFNIITASNAQSNGFIPEDNFGIAQSGFQGAERRAEAYSPLMLSIRPDKNHGVSLYYNGMYSVSAAEMNLDYGNTPFVSEYNAGIYFSAADNLKVGFEFGRESFGHIYTDGTDAQQYEQQPLILCLGVGARYQFSQLEIVGIRPFAHMSYASTELGHLGRGTVGVEFVSPQKILLGCRVGVTAGFQGSLMLYETLDSKWLTSKKNGLIIGGSLHF
ncbi:MAG: hypothetical protein ACLFQX_06885 [Candidatus Kapaibacterium sp.]